MIHIYVEDIMSRSGRTDPPKSAAPVIQTLLVAIPFIGVALLMWALFS